MEKLCEERMEQCRDRIMNTWWRLVPRGASEKPLVGKMPLLVVTPFKRSPVCGQCGHSPDKGGGCSFDIQLSSSVVEYRFVHCSHPMIPTSKCTFTNDSLQTLFCHCLFHRLCKIVNLVVKNLRIVAQ